MKAHVDMGVIIWYYFRLRMSYKDYPQQTLAMKTFIISEGHLNRLSRVISLHLRYHDLEPKEIRTFDTRLIFEAPTKDNLQITSPSEQVKY